MAFDPVSLAITAALMAAQMALTAMTKIEGARLDTLDVTVADYGTQIPRFWGRKRLEGVPIFWAERLKEKKTTSKTKGGKYAEYKYYGTFAVLIADHEIDTVSRIWLDKHLCYDMTGTGPISVSLAAVIVEGLNRPVKLQSGKNMRIYLGTEGQMPDPRMEAWCEDRYGADSCPAYRGYSYIVFQDLPLEKFGNRIPQVTIEAVNQPTAPALFETLASNGLLQYARFTPDYSRLFVANSNHGSTGGYKVWDIATRTVMVDGVLAGGWSTNGSVPGVSQDHIYTLDGAPGTDLWVHLGDGRDGYEPLLIPNTNAGMGVDAVTIYNTFGPEEHVFLRSPAGGANVALEWAGTYIQEIATGFRASSHIADPDENIWAIGSDGVTTDIYFYCLAGDRTGESHSVASPTGSTDAIYVMHNGQGGFVCNQIASAFIIDDETFTVTDTATWATFATANYTAFNNVQPGAVSIWIRQHEYSTVTLDEIRAIDFNDWIPSADVDHCVYCPALHALIGESNTPPRNLTIYYLDRVGSNGVQLMDVVGDVCDWVGLTSADVSALTQTVRGYLVTQGSGKDMIAPLLDIHDVDPRPHDFTVQFVNRGASPAGTILTDNFVREGDSTRYEVSIAQDTDIPRRVLFNYADLDADQQKNTAQAQRPLDAVDSVREQSIDLTTYVATADEAQRFVERYHRRQWNSRETITHSLTAAYLGLEPADVWNLSLDGVVHTARLRKLTVKGLVLDCEWIRESPLLSVLSGSAGAGMAGRDPDVIYIPLLTKGFFLDIPLVRDPDNSVNPVIYVGAAPYGPGGWSGAGEYQGDGTDYETLFATTDSASKSTWGTTTSTLATANANLWDRGNSVTVVLNTGTLESHTEAEIDANPLLNMAVIGDEDRYEVIQFATATLTATRTYLLSGFKRGRRGTEWAVGTHTSSDIFVLTENLAPVELGADEIGDTLYFKAASIGRTIEEAFPVVVTYEGESHKPLAPAHLKGQRDTGTNDWTISCRRRTRVGGRWMGTTTIPIGESAENYKFEIMNGASVVRTSTGSANSLLYTSAQQVTDFGSNQASITVRARQIGDLMDGRATTATF